MIILTETTDNIQVVLGSAVTTNQLQCMSVWRDVTSTTYTPGRTLSVTNNTSDVNIVPAPASSTQRVIDFLSVYNADTDSATVTIKLDANGTEYILYRDVIESGRTLNYADKVGFYITGLSLKQQKSFTFHGDAGVNFTMTNATLAERFALNTTRHLFMVDLAGYTQIRLRANVQALSASVNTPLFRIRYCVGWSTTVGNFLQIGESGHCQISLAATGYLDTGWINLASGARVDGVTIGCTEVGGDGVADPALGATDILFR